MCFKITAAQRKYYRYRGVSAELEQRGLGCSRPELAWANRQRQSEPARSAEVRKDAVDLASRELQSKIAPPA